MKNLLKTLGVLSLAASPLAAGTTTPVSKNPKNPAAINDDIGISTDIGYDSNFVWRGLNYGRDWARAAFRGTVPLIGGAGEDGAGGTALLWDVGYGTLLGDSDSFTPNLSRRPVTWPQDNKQSYQRLEAGLDLAHDFGPLTGTFGYRYIHNTGSLAAGTVANSINGRGFQGMHDIHQLSTGLKTSLGPVVLATSANYDMANGGWYFDANASSKIVVTDSISIVPHVNLGYGINYKYGFSQGMRNYVSNIPGPSGVNGFTAVTAGIDFPIRLTRNATLTPYIAINVPMNGLHNFSGRGAPNKLLLNPYSLPNTPFQTIVYGGVTLSIKWGTNDSDTSPVLIHRDLGITADVGYDSNYVWRGLNYGRNWARTALKGAIPLAESSAENNAGSTSILWDATYGSLIGDSDSFSPNMRNLPTTFPQHNKQSYQRLEAGASLAHDFGPITASFGYRYIHNTGSLSSGSLLTSLNGQGGMGIHDIHQLSTGLSASLGPIDLASSANYDMANGGWYFDANASSTFRVTDALSIVPSANIGYGVNYNYGMSQGFRAALANPAAANVGPRGVSGFTAATFAINFPLKLSRRTTFTPYIAVNVPLSGLTNFGRNNAPVGGFGAYSQPRTPFNTVLYGGVSVSVSF